MKKSSDKNTKKELIALLYIALSFVLLLSLVSFQEDYPTHNYLGVVGYGLSLSLTFLFGIGSYLLVLHLFWIGIKMIKGVPPYRYVLGSLILLFSFCTLCNLFAEAFPNRVAFLEKSIISEILPLNSQGKATLRYNLGGIITYYLLEDLPLCNLTHLFSRIGTSVLTLITLILSLLSLIDFPPVLALKTLGNRIAKLMQNVSAATVILMKKSSFLKKEREPPSIKTASRKSPLPNTPLEEGVLAALKKPIQPQKSPTPPSLSKLKLSKEEPEQESREFTQELSVPEATDYSLPPSHHLSDPIKINKVGLEKDLAGQKQVLEATLLSFGIQATVGDIHCGPTITSFEVHPATGVKVQKIKTLQDDIALKLEAKSIRIIAPIPGKAAVGVEIPSLHPQEVSFKELLNDYNSQKKKLSIPIFLGKSVRGENVISDLAKMPHCLIAGATGSGKSVCINTIVMSILMTLSPDQIKLVMIDPKKVELTQYSRLPHMIAPVVTEAHGAYLALQWLVREMQTRYEILKQLGLRNITAFNKRKVDQEFEASLPILVPDKMAMIVAIIDEFADLMMVSGSDLETPIARIAQMARAVGIHLILATQRPSREVITGIIKANFPCRIAFKVASRINSQIILDETGAESLLGNGDLLFLPPGSSQLIRAQGAFIRDEEINTILDAILKEGSTNYLIPSFDAMHSLDPTSITEEDSKDALYDQALSIILETKNASTTFLQRKLKIGYARAASLIDALERNKVIGPQEGSKPRRIYSLENSE